MAEASPAPIEAEGAAPEHLNVMGLPAFRRLWLANALSTVGDRVHQVALTWWTLATTGSMALTGAMLVATTLPAVLLGPVAGTLADRWPRRRLMIGCDLARALLVAGLTALALAGSLAPTTLLVASALLATFTTLFTPASFAVVPAVVPANGIMQATAWMEGTGQAAGVVGPALGGVITAAIGASGAFGVNAASFLASALLIAASQIPDAARGAEPEPFLASMRGGLRVLKERPAIAASLAGFAVVNLFTTAVLLLMPYFSMKVFFVGATGLGAMEAALCVGMVLASIGMGRLGEVRRRALWVCGGLAGVGLAIVAMGLWPLYPVHLAALAAAGLSMGAVNVVMLAFFQASVPPTELGRFFGLLTSLTMGLMPLAYGGYGILVTYVQPTHLLVFNGLAVCVVAAALTLVPGLREE